jgi:hypothetical protein
VIPKGSQNTARILGTAYPNGGEPFCAWFSGDDALSQVSSLADAGNAARVAYTYLGAGTFVEAAYPEPQITWTLAAGGSGANPYPGLDPFRRVIDCRWSIGPCSFAQQASNHLPLPLREFAGIWFSPRRR